MVKRAEWEQRIADWKSSGLSAEKFCADKDFTAQNLFNWSSRLKQKTKPAMRLARLVRTPAARPETDPVVIEISGARLLVREGMSEAALALAIRALRHGETQ